MSKRRSSIQARIANRAPAGRHGLTVLMLIACLVAASGTFGAEPLLPPGYAWPQAPYAKIPQPDPRQPSCPSCGSRRSLRHIEKGIVEYALPLDSYGPEWSGELLTFLTGYEQPWNPQYMVGLFPYGLKPRPNDLAAVIRREMILFGKQSREAGETAMVSTSHPDHVLSREGNEIVLTRRGERRWYFETPDLGATWRLSRVERWEHPGTFLQCAYEDSRLTALIYPDGQRTTLTYRGDLVSEIRFPGEHLVRFERDVNGFVILAERCVAEHTVERQELVASHSEMRNGQMHTKNVYRTVVDKVPAQVVQRWVFEHDHTGRLTRVVSACGAEYAIDRAEEKAAGGPRYLTVVREGDEAEFTVYEQQSLPGSYAFIERRGTGETPPTEAPIISRRLYKSINHRLVPVEEEDPAKGTKVTRTYDRSGNLKRREGGDAPSDFTYNAYRQLLTATGADGVRREWRYADDGRLLEKRVDGDVVEAWVYREDGRPVKGERLGESFTYRYDGDGWLAGIDAPDGSHAVSVDGLGRLTAQVRPDGSSISWAYRTDGQIKQIAETAAGNDAEPITTYYGYTPAGRLRRIGYPDGSRDEYTWECERVVEHRDREGQTTAFRYNDQHLVRRISQERTEAFDYDRENRLIAHGVKKIGADWAVTRYTYGPDGRLLTETSPEGETVHRYNALGRLVGTTFPDGSELIYEYGPDGQAIGLHGSHLNGVGRARGDRLY